MFLGFRVYLLLLLSNLEDALFYRWLGKKEGGFMDASLREKRIWTMPRPTGWMKRIKRRFNPSHSLYLNISVKLTLDNVLDDLISLRTWINGGEGTKTHQLFNFSQPCGGEGLKESDTFCELRALPKRHEYVYLEACPDVAPASLPLMRAGRHPTDVPRCVTHCTEQSS